MDRPAGGDPLNPHGTVRYRADVTRAEDGADEGVLWSLDRAHFPAPVTRWSSALFTTTQTEVIHQLMAESGMLLDGIAYREVDGWIYRAVVPLGGRPHQPVPRWMVPVLCRTRPALRKRLAAAHAADVSDQTGTTVTRWRGGEEDLLRERGLGYLAGELTALTPRQVGARLEEQLRFVTECLTWHIRLHAATADAIGRLGLDLTANRGWTLPEFMDLFVGLSDATLGPADVQQAIVERIRESGGLEKLAGARTLAEVAEISPDVADELQRFQEIWGLRTVRYEVAHPTVADRPDLLVRTLKEAAHAPVDAGRNSRHAERRRVAEARAIASLGNSSWTRRRLARAREAFPTREGNEATTIDVPLAGLRRLGLHLGERLGLDRADDVFDLTFQEVLASLRDPAGGGALAAVARSRRLLRQHQARHRPEEALGERASGLTTLPAGAPDLRGFPRYAAEQLAALLWYEDQITPPVEAGGPPIPRPDRASPGVDHPDVSGLGASPGVYEGPARVVRDEADFARIRPGEVVVCPIASPVWSMVLPSIGALVCDRGGIMSHPAIIAREFGRPAVVATSNATRSIVDGVRVRVDGDTGKVTLLT